ncbi:hypothetical protein C8R44DRAFT_887053 [Mycena epipterygia]|nr:hypothetical protein C8R44DRAFT_887053 [Mycena epipterygia]
MATAKIVDEGAPADSDDDDEVPALIPQDEERVAYYVEPAAYDAYLQLLVHKRNVTAVGYNELCRADVEIRRWQAAKAKRGMRRALKAGDRDKGEGPGPDEDFFGGAGHRVIEAPYLTLHYDMSASPRDWMQAESDGKRRAAPAQFPTTVRPIPSFASPTVSSMINSMCFR